MKQHIDPTEIKTIKSNTSITITMDDGSKITAYNFEFINNETTHSADGFYDGHSVEVE